MMRLELDDRRWAGWMRGWLAPAILLVAGLAVLMPVIVQGGFFWDDATLITDNPAVRLDGYNGGSSLGKIWLSHELPDYFPLTSTLFYVEWRVFEGNPLGFHIVNALLHVATAIFLWLTLREMRVPWAFAGALLFVIHPVNMESGSWIAEGKNTLSTSLMMGAAWTWWRGERQRSWGWYGGSLALFVLSLLAKTSSVMLPVVMVLVLWWKERANLWALLRTGPFFVASLGLGLVTMWFQANESIQNVPVRDDGFWSRLATAGCAVWFYVGKAVAPFDVYFTYPRWDVMKAGAIAFVPGVLVIGAAVGLWVLRKRIGRGWAAAWLGYVAMLLPILGFRNIYYMRYTLVSDHWQYPAIGIVCAALAGGVGLAARRVGHAAANGIFAAVVGVMVVLAVDAASISNVYRSEVSVWEDVLAHNPDCFLANDRMGEICWEEAEAGNPARLKEGEKYLQKAIAAGPEHTLGYADLANVYVLEGRREEAVEMVKKAFVAPMGSPVEKAAAHGIYGGLLALAGDAAGRDREFEEKLRLDPESVSSWKRTAYFCLQRNDLAGARAAYEKAVEFGPLSVDARLGLARVLGQMHDYGGAEEQVKAVLEIEPKNGEAVRMAERLAPLLLRSPMEGTPGMGPASVPASVPGKN